jgi:3-demethylubiquinone-9 3-methyltransferase
MFVYKSYKTQELYDPLQIYTGPSHIRQLVERIMPRIEQRITPHLWFDKEAKEAAEFYTSIFPNSRITHATTLRNTPSGDTEIVSFELSGQPFMAISAGPLFKFNESISFSSTAKTRKRSTITGKNSPRSQSPNSADGSKTGMASHGRSCRQPWTR